MTESIKFLVGRNDVIGYKKESTGKDFLLICSSSSHLKILLIII